MIPGHTSFILKLDGLEVLQCMPPPRFSVLVVASGGIARRVIPIRSGPRIGYAGEPDDFRL